ncbi:MAG: hemerythrin domain-containing protein [Anaerolineae bacterium]|nr:hemerythrin domain-containing protein [Anaerolineae bacterium]
MNTEEEWPNLALHLVLAHRIITRALHVIGQSCEKFSSENFPDTITREGFACYVQSFTSFLHAHHNAEDAILFPQLQEHFPEVPYAMLTRQHKAMVPLANHIATVGNSLVSKATGIEQLAKLRRCVERLTEGWHPHFKIEEQHFTTEQLSQRLPRDVHAQLCRQLGEYTRHHLQPDYLAIPFALYSLAVDERVQFATALLLPRDEHIPDVWQDKWRVMQSFLLVE